ncbi:MAG: hypothetical protein L0H29_04130, partial [Sinobacteraceae bacterium]|nr:hypothetical protein [Nevskiaceae bacterium]
NVMRDNALGLRMAKATVETAPGEPAYRVTLLRMQVRSGHLKAARKQLAMLQSMNVAGSLDGEIRDARALISSAASTPAPAQ